MLVDPEVLRAFAGQVDAASSTIREADVGIKIATAADGLPGSRAGNPTRCATSDAAPPPRGSTGGTGVDGLMRRDVGGVGSLSHRARGPGRAQYAIG